MEEEKIKSIFLNYKPELSSDLQFMSKLERNLNSVDIIKRHATKERSENRKAMAIAALAGFIVGFIFSMTLPYLTHAASLWQLSLPQDSVMKVITDNFAIFAWLIIGGAASFASMNTYGLALSVFRSKESSNY